MIFGPAPPPPVNFVHDQISIYLALFRTLFLFLGRRCFQALLRGDDQQGLLLRLLRSLRDPRGDVEGRGEDPHLQELHVA